MATFTYLILCSIFFLACYCEPIEQNVGIVGGHSISITEVPFMASLRIHNGTSHLCGGSIVHEQFILTAAHCFLGHLSYNDYQVSVGTDLRSDSKSGEIYDVEKYIVHRKFSTWTKNFDVALIKLKMPLTLGAKVNIIKMAERGYNFTGKMANVTGWGSDGGNALSPILKQVTVPIVERKECRIQYNKYNIDIFSQMVCAGKRGMDSCGGDSGGPLTIDNLQVGITSFGQGCGKDAGIYSRVPALKRWIDKKIKNNI